MLGDLPQMRIAILGRSGSGKTTYVTALHHALTTEQRHGFSIAPAANEPVEAAFRQGEIRSLEFGVPPRFPSGTSASTEWSVVLRHGGEDILLVNLFDYRGQTIDDLFDRTSESLRPDEQSDVRWLVEHAVESDSIFAFVDAVNLYHFRNNSLASKYHSGITTISRFLGLMSSNSTEAPPRRVTSAVFILAKSDSDTILWSDEELLDAGRKACSEAIQACHALGMATAVVPVGAVGRASVSTTLVDSDSVFNAPQVATRILNFPEPEHVELPILFGAANVLARRRTESSPGATLSGLRERWRLDGGSRGTRSLPRAVLNDLNQALELAGVRGGD